MFKEFQVGEYVYFHIKPKKISLRIGSRAKLAPWYCGPFKILERIEIMAYRLALPLIVKFLDVFYVSLLKIYVKDIDHVIYWFLLEVEIEGEFQSKPIKTSVHIVVEITHALKQSNRVS